MIPCPSAGTQGGEKRKLHASIKEYLHALQGNLPLHILTRYRVEPHHSKPHKFFVYPERGSPSLAERIAVLGEIKKFMADMAVKGVIPPRRLLLVFPGGRNLPTVSTVVPFSKSPNGLTLYVKGEIDAETPLHIVGVNQYETIAGLYAYKRIGSNGTFVRNVYISEKGVQIGEVDAIHIGDKKSVYEFKHIYTVPNELEPPRSSLDTYNFLKPFLGDPEFHLVLTTKKHIPKSLIRALSDKMKSLVDTGAVHVVRIDKDGYWLVHEKTF